jgi:hypothetical protein
MARAQRRGGRGSSEEREFYRALMDGRWRLSDLDAFSHIYGQCYAFVYCLDTDLEIRDRERVDEAFANYPWRGGYSYVNIYSVLQYQVPTKDRPHLKAISYNSPGWIDLWLHVDAAIEIAKAVTALSLSAAAAANAYRSINKALSQAKVDREQAKTDLLRQKQVQIRMLTSMARSFARFLGFKSLDQLNKRTGDPEVSVKLLLAHYRRLKKLTDFAAKGKIQLPVALSDETSVESGVDMKRRGKRGSPPHKQRRSK